VLKERFMRNLRGWGGALSVCTWAPALAHARQGHEACPPLRELSQNGQHGLFVFSGSNQLGDGRAPSRVAGSFAELHHRQKRSARDLLFRLGQPVEHLLCAGCQRSSDAP
jgi:hypothetical protein